MGPVTGLLFLFGLPFAVFNHGIASGGDVLRMAAGLLIAGGVLALILPRRLGIASLGGIIGSLAAAVTALLSSQASLLGPFLALAAAFGVVGGIALFRISRRNAPKAPRTTPHGL